MKLTKYIRGILYLWLVAICAAITMYGILFMMIETTHWLRGFVSLASLLTVLVFAVWKVEDFFN